MKSKAIILAILVFIIFWLYNFTSCASESNDQLWVKVNTATVNGINSNLPDSAINAISQLITHNDKGINNQKIIDSLVMSGANCLDKEANWTDELMSRKIYETLKKCNGNIVTDSLIRQVFKPEIRLRALFLGVKWALKVPRKSSMIRL